MLSLQFSLNSLRGKKALTSSPLPLLCLRISPLLPSLGKRSRNLPSRRCSREIQLSASRPGVLSTPLDSCISPSTIDHALVGFIRGTRKVTEVAHLVWQTIVSKGDIVVDATCGNGHDTLALLKIVADESKKGCVYGMDIQVSALESTSSLLDESVTPKEKELVKLFHLCHSRMEDVIPKDSAVRLVAFNLGYLPGGDKAIITKSRTTLPALEAATRILQSGGLLSTIVYVGHPGGREEFETVQHFASRLPVETWVCSKFEMLNRPNSPVLVLLFKK